MDNSGFGVEVQDMDDNPLPTVVSPKYNNATFVVARPGESFQVIISMSEESQKNHVKAKVHVDGKDVGFLTWINTGRTVVEGFRATYDSLYRFQFSDAAKQDDEEDVKEDPIDDDEDDDFTLSPTEPGAILVEFIQFLKPSDSFCRFGCNDRYNPYGRSKPSPIARDSYVAKQPEMRPGSKWWKRPSLSTSAGSLFEKPSATTQRNNSSNASSLVASRRSSYSSRYSTPYSNPSYDTQSRYSGYSGYAGGGAYGGGSAYGGGGGSSYYGSEYSSGQRYGSSQSQAGGRRRCVHTRWRQGPTLGQIVLYYQTPDCLLLRGVLTPEENEEHKELLVSSGYYEEMHRRTQKRRQRAKSQRDRRRANYEPKIEPDLIIEIDCDTPTPAVASSSAMAISDPQTMKRENKHFVAPSGQEICDLTRQDHMEVWYVRKRKKTTVPLIPVE